MPKPLIITAKKLPMEPIGVKVDPSVFGKQSGGVRLLPGETDEAKGIDVARIASGAPLSTSTSAPKKKSKKSNGLGLGLAVAVGAALIFRKKS